MFKYTIKTLLSTKNPGYTPVCVLFFPYIFTAYDRVGRDLYGFAVCVFIFAQHDHIDRGTSHDSFKQRQCVRVSSTMYFFLL